ncbi:MAG: AMP-dependent synthetase/ligase [Holophagaceae bacterium]
MSSEIKTIPDLFYEALKRDISDALAYKHNGSYHPISHREYKDLVEWVALALREKGLKTHDRVAIISENRPEWAIADFACAILGLPTVVLYPTLVSSQAAFILQHSEVSWVICSDSNQLNKIMESWSELPHLHTVVVMEGEVPIVPHKNIYTWDQLVSWGRALSEHQAEVKQWASAVKPEDLLTIIYTSGTTGEPKGAMLTHRNLITNILDSAKLLNLSAGDRSLSFLPLNHIFERMVGHFTMMHVGVSIYYSEGVAKVPDNLLEVRPTVLLAVPRIYEKVFNRTLFTAAQAPLLRRLVFSLAMSIGRGSLPYRYAGRPLPFYLKYLHRVASKLVFEKILARLGGNLRMAASGGAPLAPKVLEFFWAIGLDILEGYGLSETSPVISFNRFGHIVPGSVGRPLYDTWEGRPFVKIAEDGEILCQGPNIMKGYWKNEKDTREAIGPDGYFHTGDIGYLKDGNLYITDRKKDLIITSGGKNVAPQPIENALKTNKYISQAVVLGDTQNFISALIVPDFEVLEPWAKRQKISFQSREDLISNPRVVQKVMNQVNKINTQFSNYEQVKKIVLLGHEMTQETGELTPTMKVKRRVVNEKYQKQIAEIYS